MRMRDFWWEFEARQREAQQIKKLSKGGDKWEGPEWDDARLRHAEKMKARHD